MISEGVSDGARSIDEVLDRLDRIEAALAMLVRTEERDWYSVEEVAEILSRKPFTVREWARNNRLRPEHCEKLHNGEWRISKEEVTRIKEEGLLKQRFQQ